MSRDKLHSTFKEIRNYSDFIEKATDKCNYRGGKGFGFKRNKKSCDKLRNAGCKWMEEDGISGCVLDYTKDDLTPLSKMQQYLNMSKEERKKLKNDSLEEVAELKKKRKSKRKKRSKNKKRKTRKVTKKRKHTKRR